MRKKITDDAFEADAAANLREDEEIVLSDVRTIRKNKRTPPAPKPLPVIEVEDDDEGELVEDENPFPLGTVGFRAFGDDSDPQAVTECNILVVRKPDGAGDNFLNPCKSRVSELPIRNVDLSTSESEIEELVRMNSGGGHYYLQTQFGNRHGRGWSVSLADPPAAIREAKAAANPPPAVAEPAAPPVDPITSFIDSLEKQKRMRDLLFGDTERSLKDEIDKLRTDLAAKSATPPEPISEELTLWKMATSMPESDAQSRLFDRLAPKDEEGSRHWVADVISVVMENKEAIGSMLGGLLGGVAPPAGPPNIADLMKMQPPNALPPAETAKPREIFKRTAAEPPPELKPDPELSTAETPMPDRDAIDAEPVIETADAKPAKARGKAK